MDGTNTENQNIETQTHKKQQFQKVPNNDKQSSNNENNQFLKNKESPQTEEPLSTVELLLQSWGLYNSLGTIFKGKANNNNLNPTYYISLFYFLEHLIDIECLIDIKESDIDQLIPLFGIKIKFKKHLAEWRIANVSLTKTIHTLPLPRKNEIF